MPDGTIDCLGEGKFERVLTSFDEDGPDAAIVKLSPSTAIVVEARTWVGFDRRRPADGPAVGFDFGVCTEGVLVYSVNADMPTPTPPIEIFPAAAGEDPSCSLLPLATYGVGEGMVSRFEDPAAGVTVEVMEEVGNGYRVRIVSGE